MAAAQLTGDRFGVAAAWTLATALPLASSMIPTDDVMPLRLIALGFGVAAGLLAVTSGRLPRPLALGLLAFLAVFSVAALLGETPLLSLIGRFPRYEGLPVVGLYAAAMWVGARAFGRSSQSNREAAYSAIAVAAMASAAVVGYQALMFPGERTPGVLNSAMVMGTFGLISVGMLGWKIWSEPRVLWIIGVVSGVIIIVLSGSRGALLGLAPALLLTVLWRPWLKPSPRHLWIAPTVGVVAVMGGAYVVLRYQDQLALLQRFTDLDRLAMWQDTWQLVGANPWWGVGPGRFIDAIGAYHSDFYHGAAAGATHWDSPHSGVLQVLAATGVLGFVTLVAVVCVIGARMLQDRAWDPWRLGAATTAVSVGISFATSMTDPISGPIVALVLGGAVSVPVADARLEWLDKALAACAAGLALVLGGTLVAAEWTYSEGIYRSQTPVSTMLAATQIRPWDADLARRVAFSITVLAKRGEVDPSVGLALAERTCPRLPGSVECLHVLADARRAAGDLMGSLEALEHALRLDPHNRLTLAMQQKLAEGSPKR